MKPFSPLRRALLASGLALSMTASAATIFSDDFTDGDISDWSALGTVDAYNGESIRLRATSTASRAVSTDGGGSWTTALTVANGQDNGTHYSTSISPAGIANNTQVQLRFRSTGATTGDYCCGQSVAVSGTGGAPTDPDITAPASLNFGNLAPGASSTPSAIIDNNGSADLLIGNVSNPSAPFSIAANNCSTVAPGSSCQIDVSFAPTAEGSYSSSTVISSNDPDEGSLTISLSGSAAASGGSVQNFDPLGGSGSVSRSQLTFNTLINGSDPGTLQDYSHYALPTEAAMPSNQFEGSLELFGEASGGGFDEQVDTFRYTGNGDTTRKHLPEFNFEFVQTGSHIFPVQRGSIPSSHPEWEYVLTPGRVWNENGDNGYSRVALPFSLQQKNANCIHNGVMTFLFKDDGSVSDVAYQIASETCLYFRICGGSWPQAIHRTA